MLFRCCCCSCIPFFLLTVVVGLYSTTRVVVPVHAWIQQQPMIPSCCFASMLCLKQSNNIATRNVHAPPLQQWVVQHYHHCHDQHRRGMMTMTLSSNHLPDCSTSHEDAERYDDDIMPQTNSRSIVHNNNNNNNKRSDATSCPSPPPPTLYRLWNNHNDNNNSRRQWLLQQLPLTVTAVTASAAAVMFVDSKSHPANALVKGVAPPTKSAADTQRPKCTNVEECQAIAAQKEQQEREVQEANQRPVLVTSRGTRYRDIMDPTTTTTTTTTPAAGVAVVQNGDTVTVYYKVLKLGKRSYDGLSGEGTVIFSRGYGYEDDETAGPRIQSWTTTVGDASNIDAFNDAMIGCTIGTIRRIVVLPQNGWRKPGQYCDGGPGGSGTGGELRTDYIVVPTATMVATESCFDTTKQPYPQTYGPQRRMAQRFDQSLILEVEVVDINSSKRG